MRQIAVTAEHVYGLSSGPDGDHIAIFDWEGASLITIPCPSAVQRLCSTTNGIIACQTLHGKIYEGTYQTDSRGISAQYPIVTPSTLNLLATLPSPCMWFDLLAASSSTEESNIPAISNISRNEHNMLYVNGTLIASNCTSFVLHPDFLIYSTLKHQVEFIPTCVITDPNDSMEYASIFSRRVERGSTIVTVVPGNVQLVLQLPRGNLETVSPRTLVLSLVRHHLNRHEYREALLACRKHRIDMNILYDHDPEDWLLHVDDFVGQVDNSDHINLFLSGIRNENVLATMYSYYGAALHVATNNSATNKVNSICDTIRVAMQKTNDSKFFNSILTSYVQKSPQQLEEMLETIAGLKAADPSGKSMELAIKYIIVFVDVEHLYQVALGMYDFGLAIMVAQQSHKV